MSSPLDAANKRPFQFWDRTYRRGKWDTLFLIALASLVITRLFAIWVSWDLGPYADEDNYALRGTSFLRMLFTAPPEMHEHYLQEFYYEGYWPPLYSLIIGPLHILGEETAVRIFLVVCDILAGILFYRLALKVISQKAASVALFLYAINPFLWVASFSILSEGLFNLAIFAFLLSYIKLVEIETIQKSNALILVLLVGLTMGSALMIRSAFILIFILVLGLSVIKFWKHKSKLYVFLGASALMLSLTIPWNLLIKEREGSFMFMHTISAQQFYMKFVDRAGGWNSVKDRIAREASAENKSPQEQAKLKTNEYFHNIDSILAPLGVMIRDFRVDYLLGISDYENRLRLGLYNAEGINADINWLILLYHEFIRLPIIILGVIPFLVPLGTWKYKELFFVTAIGTASVGVLGLTWGRHLVNLMPILIIGAAITLQHAKRVLNRGQMAIFSISLLLASLIGFNIWQCRYSGYWTKTYEPKLISIGKGYTIQDQIQLRRFDGCIDELLLVDSEDNWEISTRSLLQSDASFIPVNNGQNLTPDGFVLLDIRPTKLGQPIQYVNYLINGKKGIIPLDRGRILPQWQDLPNTCVKFKQ